MSYDPLCELTILMPCLNEAETLETCIRKAQTYLQENIIAGEILVADNGSTDGSQLIATEMGVRIINVEIKGYGAALLAGISASKGKFVIIGDADDSYDFTQLAPFVEKLRDGNDLVMGNRFKGGIKPGAMPFLHKYLGNPVLSTVGKIFFCSPINDFHCGLRGFKREAILQLDLRTTGMEFASEMVVKATLHKLRIVEVPTILYKDGRSRPPHLRTWSDGWRHLRFLLLYSPRWLFLYPGIFFIVIGAAAFGWLSTGPKEVGSIVFDVNTFLYAALAILMGFQSVIFAVFSKVFAITEKLLPEDPSFNRLFQWINLERGLIVGITFIVTGLIRSVAGVHYWELHSFGQLNYSLALRIVIPAVTLLAMGFQIILSSFFLSILGLKRQ